MSPMYRTSTRCCQTVKALSLYVNVPYACTSVYQLECMVLKYIAK